ncbi:MAG TPA: Lrp/AsnC ligand binding domain-containing protein [Actinomycetota bacterium]|nr:Lrp/AsnC ligand binding domain-containing protein [Actinomycetota bacterium]
MVKAYLLVNAEAGTEASVARRARTLDGVLAVERVQGPYDLVVRAQVTRPEQLDRDLLPRLRLIEGVLRVLPCQVGTLQPEARALAS